MLGVGGNDLASVSSRLGIGTAANGKVACLGTRSGKDQLSRLHQANAQRRPYAGSCLIYDFLRRKTRGME